MSFGGENPSFEELMEVVQRQQEVIEIFEQQMGACRMECLRLAEENERKNEDIKILREVEISMKAEINSLKSEKDYMMDHQTRESEKKKADSELITVGNLRMKCKEMTYELEKLKTKQIGVELELETQKQNNTFIRTELNEEKLQRQDEKLRMAVSIETMKEEMSIKCDELQKCIYKYQKEVARMETEKDIKNQREQQLEKHYEKLMEEIRETRKEKTSVISKCSSMTAEIVELRAKMQHLRSRLPRNEHDIEDMNKLLGDQSHLIAALREETKLLTRKLEADSKEYRQTIKQLKHGKRELEQRIETLLHVE